jgi:hypothetical protein
MNRRIWLGHPEIFWLKLLSKNLVRFLVIAVNRRNSGTQHLGKVSPNGSLLRPPNHRHTEQSEGILSAFQRYRLPTDVEWSRAIGLPHETGATPAERSGGIKNVYPWGNRFPPPNDFGNYAGTESTAGAPGVPQLILAIAEGANPIDALLGTYQPGRSTRLA